MLFLIVHGLPNKSRFPVSSDGINMGDKLYRQDPKYLPNLTLPKLPYPNKFYGYTRHRLKNRPVEAAYWDQMLSKINEKWDENKKEIKKGKLVF